MTTDESGDPFERDITSEEAFEARFSELIVTATQNGIDPLGSWVCRTDGTTHDMEITVVELDDRGE
jgi:hypothetical protein